MSNKSGKNKTITLTSENRLLLWERIFSELPIDKLKKPIVGTINGNCLDWIEKLPDKFIDLLFLDPPYNLKKNFHEFKFNRMDVLKYTAWLDNTIKAILPLLKSTASVYICGDWFSSVSIYEVASKYFILRNRITWEREKGRGSKTNWKNSSEDIWFCTLSNKYTFNLDDVKLRRKVIAPYTENGSPKDWRKTDKGNFRDTHPSNIWTDITIPFWSMPENTAHPTQKSEKLLAKIILCSSNKGDFVFDPFLGSGTTSVVAKKLGRNYLGIELNKEFCLLTEKRLLLADTNSKIQGFTEGVFWERNTFSIQSK